LFSLRRVLAAASVEMATSGFVLGMRGIRSLVSSLVYPGHEDGKRLFRFLKFPAK
jgi:hypothetical protein